MDALVTVAVFGQPHELAVVRARLESEGIFCHAQDENTVAAHPFYSHLVGGIKLQVRAEDEQAALAILAEAGVGEAVDELDGAQDEVENGPVKTAPLISPGTAKFIGLAFVALIALALLLLS